MTAHYRHEWYQTDAKVVVTVLIKNAAENDYAVDIQERSILMTTKDGYKLNVNLFAAVNTRRSHHRATATKVEIVLFKEIAQNWDSLEQKASAEVAEAPPQLHKKDWDSIAREAEKKDEEEAQSEEALQRLFRKVYSKATPDMRKAMNKSFTESGGTVLSTNWNEVSKEKVEVKPPEGTEFKNWED